MLFKFGTKKLVMDRIRGCVAGLRKHLHEDPFLKTAAQMMGVYRPVDEHVVQSYIGALGLVEAAFFDVLKGAKRRDLDLPVIPYPDAKSGILQFIATMPGPS